MVLEQYSTAVLNIEIAVEYCPCFGEYQLVQNVYSRLLRVDSTIGDGV